MTAITAQELSDMRAVADDFFPDTCTISTPSDSVDGTGSPIETFADTYTGVACRVDPAGSGDETVRSLALEGKSTWWLNIPYDQDIDITYRVTHDSKTYQIVAVEDTQSYRTIRRAMMVRVGDGS